MKSSICSDPSTQYSRSEPAIFESSRMSDQFEWRLPRYPTKAPTLPAKPAVELILVRVESKSLISRDSDVRLRMPPKGLLANALPFGGAPWLLSLPSFIVLYHLLRNDGPYTFLGDEQKFPVYARSTTLLPAAALYSCNICDVCQRASDHLVENSRPVRDKFQSKQRAHHQAFQENITRDFFRKTRLRLAVHTPCRDTRLTPDSHPMLFRYSTTGKHTFGFSSAEPPLRRAL